MDSECEGRGQRVRNRVRFEDRKWVCFVEFRVEIGFVLRFRFRWGWAVGPGAAAGWEWVRFAGRKWLWFVRVRGRKWVRFANLRRRGRGVRLSGDRTPRRRGDRGARTGTGSGGRPSMPGGRRV